MRDRVADVLAQRAALDRGAAPAVLLSLLLHGGAIAAAVYMAMHQPAPQPVRLVSIRFAPSPRATPAPARPVAPPVEQPKPPEPRIEEPKPITAPPPPVAAAQKPPEKNTVPTSPFGRSTKKGSDAPAPAPPTTAPPANVPGVAAEVPVGGSGIAGIEGGDFPYTIYIERMQTIIGRNWIRPQVPPGVETTIYFRIDRDGTIRDVENKPASGIGAFDRAAMRAVIASSPLPPLPYGYDGTHLGVYLKFR